MSDPDDNLFLFRFILKVAKDEDDDNIVNMADVKTIFKDLDNDGDGNVELDEFLVNKILMLPSEETFGADIPEQSKNTFLVMQGFLLECYQVHS